MRKQTQYIFFGVIIIAVLIAGILIGSSFQKRIQSFDLNTCEGLAKNLDREIDTIKDKCIVANKKPVILVGGELINVSTSYHEYEAVEKYTHKLFIRGATGYYDLYINSESETVPYKVGYFYKFDLGRICTLIFSAHSSGMFYDPDLNALQPMTC